MRFMIGCNSTLVCPPDRLVFCDDHVAIYDLPVGEIIHDSESNRDYTLTASGDLQAVLPFVESRHAEGSITFAPTNSNARFSPCI